tara:strand:- start:2130 stop:2618 length:489 start_codon:yes stop_codon:yes gene_type:complete
MPSGINPSLGCTPIQGCTAQDYYLPGKGVWAPKPVVSGKKAMIGAIAGTALGTYAGRGSDPFTMAAFAVGGLILGHETGAMFDKVDQMYATMLLQKSLMHNKSGQSSTWRNPDKNIKVTATPLTNGTCREFVTEVTVGNNIKQVRGTACRVGNEWELKEMSQ